MKVLMTADSVGGVWYYALELARALNNMNVEVILATMGAALSRSQSAEVKALPNVTAYESEFRLEWMPDPWTDVREAGAWLLGIADETDPDVVHLNDYAHGALPWQTPVLMAGHSCVLSWWQAVRAEPAPAEWDRYRDAVARGLRAADLVVAPTYAMLSALAASYGPLSRWQIIANARDAKVYLPGSKEPMILTAGRLWDGAKNVQALVQIAPSLSWPVLVAGEKDGPDGSSALLDNVRALGRLSSSALAAYYARASIYVLPARYEPFGLSALEAALAGCALVLGDVSSLREVWADAAVLIPPDDPEAMREAIEDFIGDPQLRARYAARARARALRFTPQRMGAAYHEAYSDLIAERQAFWSRLRRAAI